MNDIERINKAKQIVTSYSSADWTGMKSILAPNAVYDEIGSQRKFTSADQMIGTLQAWKQVMADSKGTITNAFGAGDTVIIEVTWDGTQNGPFPGPSGAIPPSGKFQKTQAVLVVKFDGDKIQEIRHYFDMLSFLQQIGAMSAANA